MKQTGNYEVHTSEFWKKIQKDEKKFRNVAKAHFGIKHLIHALFESFIILINCGMRMLIEDCKSVAFEDFVCHGKLVTGKF